MTSQLAPKTRLYFRHWVVVLVIVVDVVFGILSTIGSKEREGEVRGDSRAKHRQTWTSSKNEEEEKKGERN